MVVIIARTQQAAGLVFLDLRIYKAFLHTAKGMSESSRITAEPLEGDTMQLDFFSMPQMH